MRVRQVPAAVGSGGDYAVINRLSLSVDVTGENPGERLDRVVENAGGRT
jgi:hypothetical protein